MEIKIEHRLTEVEERSKSNTHRLDELEKRQDNLDDLVSTVKVLAVREENVENDVKEIELLTYNSLAGAKYPLAGMTYSPDFDESVPVNTDISVFANAGITARFV